MTKGCGNHTMATPSCGSYCSSSSDCKDANGGCTSCIGNVCSEPDICGTVCSGSGQCQSSSKCSQCVGYLCSEPASCGQNCVSSGQCQSNPGNCKACIGTLCDDYVACGGSCGGDDWCSPSCPVCSLHAKCATSAKHNNWINNATKNEIKQWIAEKKKNQESEENKQKYLQNHL